MSLAPEDSVSAPPEILTADLAPRARSDAALVRPGAMIAGKYRIERIIGEGGMSIVASAIHDDLGERVALKVLKGDAGDPDRARRILREAQITLRLQSVHVARSLDAGTLPDGAPYLVMELLEGEDLGAVLRARGPLPVDLAVDCVIQVCDALGEAHRLGVVHRDLKPSNLFLTRRADGTPLVKVVDFGIAKALASDASASETASGTNGFVGSPLYAAPEQVRDAKHVGPRADLFSLGIVLHELLTGRTPFEAKGASAALAAIVADAPKRLREHGAELPAELEAIVLRCLEKDPDARYPSASAVATALAGFASPLGRAIAARMAPLNDVDATARDAGESDDRSPLAWGAPHGPTERRRNGIVLGGIAAAAIAGAILIAARAREPDAPPRSDVSATPLEVGVTASEVPTSDGPLEPPAVVTAKAVTAVPEVESAAAPASSAPLARTNPANPARRPVAAAPGGAAAPKPKTAAAATAQPVDSWGGADIEAATSRRH